MAILMYFIFCSVVILLIFRIKSRYTYVFGLGLLAINLLVLTLVIYALRISNYRYSLQFEYYTIRFLNQIKISYYDTKNIMLIAIVSFLSLLFYLFSKNNKVLALNGRRWKCLGLFIIATAFFLYLNSQTYAQRVYIGFHTAANEGWEKLYKALDKVGTGYSYLYILSVCILPYLNFAAGYDRTRMLFKKKQMLALGFSTLALQTMFFFLLFLTPIRYYLGGAWMYDMQTISVAYREMISSYIFVCTGILSAVLVFVLIKSYELRDADLSRSWNRFQKIKIVMKDIRHVFHTFKNLMFLLTILNDKAIENFGKPEGMESLLELKRNVNLFSDKLKKYFVVYSYPSLMMDEVDIAECISCATDRAEKMYGVRIDVSFECSEAYVYGAVDEFTEVFYNLLSNAADARKKDGKIQIRVWCEEKWVCISVWDDGKGMDRKMQRNLFRPFVSSKKTFGNWGIGLSYVKKIVDASDGFVNVKSSLGDYTEFQIILPNSK